MRSDDVGAAGALGESFLLGYRKELYMAAFGRTIKAAKVDTKELNKELKAKLSRSKVAATEELDGLLCSLSDKVADVRSALATAAADGADSVGEGVDTLVKNTRKGIKSLDKRWQKMDKKQKVAVAGGLLAVLAAAVAAPSVARKVRQAR